MKIYILFGQTATGKTSKALELCDKENGEIVNFDSRQIYKKLDIITGKDIPKGPQYKIWLYDIIDPKTIFSSAEYAKLAEQTISDILFRGKTPILVGGTGYYLRHLLFGAPESTVKEDWDLRTKLEKNTVEELQAQLQEVNSEMLSALNNSDRNNPRRLIRRIEIAQQGGTLQPVPSTSETLTTRLANLRGLKRPITITFMPFFHYSRIRVQEKITLRVEERIKEGAFDEVKKLLKEGYTKDDPGLNAIGYKQVVAYLNNEHTLSEMKKQWITKEVQYAKRQKTYFNKYFQIKLTE